MVTILVVDDDPIDQRFIARALDQLDDTVRLEIASSGDEALHALDRPEPPDLIVLDLMMPGIDGRRLLLQLEGHDDWSEIPVVVLSTANDPEEERFCLAHRARAYLVKPDSRRGYAQIASRLRQEWRRDDRRGSTSNPAA
ncbi:response regulator [Parvularcula bermudensis HTCC2503]|uniref:Response regulator n=1 Tax=Parvularcula bermudensis (strain ATCC BAA-594 / HTCC2503 / KCTC 12087) TaxID=314260 RepID=E0TGE3_PARBH|nr:response regulator [Parvularcula bermudensis]ADM09186.1 response regulator [Parvularcula bermudensis HTCC2503]